MIDRELNLTCSLGLSSLQSCRWGAQTSGFCGRGLRRGEPARSTDEVSFFAIHATLNPTRPKKDLGAQAAVKAPRLSHARGLVVREQHAIRPLNIDADQATLQNMSTQC